MLIGISIGLFCSNCAVKKNNNGEDGSYANLIQRDTVKINNNDGVKRIIYSFQLTNDKKILKSILEQKYVDISGNGNFQFRNFQEIYFTDDGAFEVLFNTKGIRVGTESGGEVIQYNQDVFRLDDKKRIKEVRLMSEFRTILDLYKTRDTIFNMMNNGYNGTPISKFSDADTIIFLPLNE